MGKTSHFVFCPMKECGKNAHTPGPTFLSLRENKGTVGVCKETGCIVISCQSWQFEKKSAT